MLKTLDTAPESSVRPPDAPKVLCVDDERVILNVMERILSDAYHVLTAQSGLEGLEILKKNPDTVVIISDQKMEGMSGTEFLLQSQTIAPDAIRIMVTAYSDIDLIIESINKGQIYKFIPKPFEAEHFRVSVQRAVEHYLHKKAYEKAYRELQATQERLIRAEKLSALGKLMSGVSHELGSPLANIHHAVTLARHEWEDLKEFLNTAASGRASFIEIQLMLREKKVSELTADFERIMNTISDASLFAMDLIRDLKGFSRTDDRQWADIRIQEQVDRAINLVQTKFKHMVTFHREFEDLPTIKGLPGPLTQVMVNVIHNSAQSIEREGDIWIHAWRDNGSIHISIKDNGKGIPEEYLDRIFEPGFTTKPEEEGTGLGLAITQGIVEKHGGHIRVASRVGEGSEFTITLPIVPPA